MNAPTQPAATGTAIAEQRKLIPRIADRYGVDAGKLLTTLRQTVFRQTGDLTVTDEEMLGLLVVADQYKLNPFTRELFAFYDPKKGVIPIVSVDGWSRIINTHDDYDGIEFRYSESIANPDGGKPCPEWCEAVIYHKNRGRPTVVREYLDEVYIGKRGNPPKNGPWQTHTKRFLRHKTLIQGARVAFGFSGIYDEDEAQRIVEVQVVESPMTQGANTAGLADALAARAARNTEPVDAEFTDAASKPADGEAAEAAHTEAEPASTDEGEGEPDPAEIDKAIKTADDAQISALIERIYLIRDIDVRKDLTRKALARKGELIAR